MKATTSPKVLWSICCLFALSPMLEAVPLTSIDFETDDFGIPLVNGQHIESLIEAVPEFSGIELGTLVEPTEFGNYVLIYAGVGEGHLGAAIFDSDIGGDNDFPGTLDPDLLVDLGNILIVQSSENPEQTVPGIFDVPNDHYSTDPGGTIYFDFLRPVSLTSIDLVDIDIRGAVVTLIDSEENARVYNVSNHWSFDIYSDGPKGYDTLDLTLLTDQYGEGGGVATVLQDPLFNPESVIGLRVEILGSGAIDNVRLVPEPATLALLALGSTLLVGRKRRAIRRS